MELTEQEKRLIAAYRLADDRARYDARRILENNKRNTITIAEIVSIADLLSMTVDELFTDYH